MSTRVTEKGVGTDARLVKDSKIVFKVGSQKDQVEERPMVKFRYVRATGNWRATGDDGIDLWKDDEIKVWNWEDEDWWYGERMDDRTCKRGLFPAKFVEPTSGPTLKTHQSGPEATTSDEVLHIEASKHVEAKKKEEYAHIREKKKKKKIDKMNDAEKALVDRRRKMKQLIKGGSEAEEGSSDAQADEIAEVFSKASKSSSKPKGKK